MTRLPRFFVMAAALLLALLACGAPGRVPAAPPTSLPTAPPTPSSPTPAIPPPAAESPAAAPLPAAEPGWEVVAPGLDLRVAWMWISGVSDPVELTVVRIDPTRYDLRAHYGLDRPATVAGWADRTGAAVLINGAFFEPGKRVIGLLVEDGHAYGEPLDDHGGMLSVYAGVPMVRALEDWPFQPGEPLDYAIQGRPMLLKPGGFPADFDLSPEASRRTVIAQDREGRILFMVNDYGAVSLYALRDWLAATPELNISAAFNLDGGGSTGLALRAGGRDLLIDSWWEVATAVAAYPRSAPGTGE